MAKNYGAVRGLSRFEGFTDAVFAIALTLLIVEIQPPGAPIGSHGYDSLLRAMAEQWREHLALTLCYVTIGAGLALLTVAWFLLPQPKPRFRPGQEPDRDEKEET